MNDFFDQLPTPPREKVVRGVWYAGVSVAGLAGFLTVMPYVNQALSLGLEGATLFVKLGAVGVIGAAGAYTAMSFWTPFKRKVESMARNTTIAIFGEDPITPLHMWLAEVREDLDGVLTSAREIGGLIAENDKTVEDNLHFLSEADKRVAAATKRHGENSIQTRTASIEAKGFKDRADNANRINHPLKATYVTLSQVGDAIKMTERQAETDIETATLEWRAALAAEKAIGKAQRSLGKRSQRYVEATMAFDIIRQKYAGTFGQLRALRQQTEETISRMDLNDAVAHEEALERLRENSQKLLGFQPTLPAPDFTTNQGTPVLIEGRSVNELKLFDDK